MLHPTGQAHIGAKPRTWPSDQLPTICALSAAALRRSVASLSPELSQCPSQTRHAQRRWARTRARSRASLVRSAVSTSQHLYRRPCSPLHSPAIRESTRKTLRDRRRALPASGVKICSAERASCGKRGDALAAAGAEPRMRRARSPAIGVARGLIFHFRPAHGGSLLASEPWPRRQRRTRPGSISATSPGGRTAAITNAGPVARGQSKLRGEMALKYTPTTIVAAIKRRVRRYPDASYPLSRIARPYGRHRTEPPTELHATTYGSAESWRDSLLADARFRAMRSCRF
jgi:hypothetical protein